MITREEIVSIWKRVKKNEEENRAVDKQVPKIEKIGITGGPCSGKTSLMATLPQRIEDFSGYDAYVCNEAATTLIEQRMRLKKALREKQWNKFWGYQEKIFRHQFNNESLMIECAEIEERDAVILCDRPLPDNRAYFPEGERGEEMYKAILRKATGLTPPEALARYKAFVKLTTAANGAEAFYTLENNAARDETSAEARYLDRRIEEAYLGCDRLRVIDNSTDFKIKLERATHAVFHALGMPVPLEIERKYRLPSVPCAQHFPISYRKVSIQQAYLRSENPNEEVRIRRRTHDGDSTYFLTRKAEKEPGVRVEVENQIDWREYVKLFDTMRDLRCAVIEKDRYCFLWNNQYFELDIFKNFPMPLCVLEVELTNLQDSVVLPSFLDISEEDDVTGDPRFSNRALAERLAIYREKQFDLMKTPFL